MFVLPLPRTTSRSFTPPLGNLVDRLFADSFERRITDAAPSTRSPALDVSETDSAYTVAFDVPGVTREQLKVSVEGRRVSLETVDAPKADAAQAVGGDEAAAAAVKPASARSLYRERSIARYARSVSLPAEVDEAASQATFENGVLTLTLAKKRATGARRIAIN
jgi:HSP20 family protein